MTKDADNDVHARSPTSVLEAIGVGLFVVDEAGEPWIQNAIAERLLALKRREQTLLSILTNKGLAVLNDEKPVHRDDECTLSAYDEFGKRMVISYRVVRSRRLGVVFALRDVTESERVRDKQRQLERLSQLGKACAMVAHEIGNPLAAIKATIQSIEPEVAIAGLKDPINAVYLEIDRLDKILDQLLGFVRHRTPNRKKANLPTIIEAAEKVVTTRNVTVKVEYGILKPVYVDVSQITQVIINLFLNAADAMPQGGTIFVFAGIEGNDIIIRVTDEGPGIAEEQRSQVFESFYTTKPKGTGLGLPVCYRIVNDHGGTIFIEDQQQQGASIVVKLPRGS